ncbi:MAG TPA: SCP2 sterol-binding domain-containing protein [Solirubrobacteraceae bacterium]
MSVVSERGRIGARSVVSRGGSRVAKLDSRPIPHRVILRVIGRAIPRRFDPEAAGDLDAVFELRVRDPGGGEPARFQLKVADRRCEVSAGPASDPAASATLGADDLIRMVSGAISFPQLLASGRLELAGNPFVALRFPGLFRLPSHPVEK